MQAQKELGEAELPDEATDTVVFRPKAKMVKFRKALVPMLVGAAIIEVFLELVIIVLGLIAHLPYLLILVTIMTPLVLAVVFVAWGYVKTTNMPRMKPIMTLSPEGFSVETVFEPSLGTIPWDEIASVHSGNLLGIPLVRIIPKNKTSLKACLGKRARFLWMYWMPGGLAFSCIPFSMSPADLAARINRYRERGL